MKRIFAAYAPPLIWATVVLIVGAQNDLRVPDVSFDMPIPKDKVAHFALYGVLGGLAGRSWLRAGCRPAALWLILGMMTLGALDELHQMTLPNRSAEFGDWVADAAGSLTGFLVMSRAWRDRRKRRG